MPHGDGFVEEAALSSGLAVVHDAIPARYASEALLTHYDLRGDLKRIPTEKDDTFHLMTAGGEFLVKISPPGEHAGIVNLQSSAMTFAAERAPRLPVQTLVVNSIGQLETRLADPASGAPRILRVMKYMQGDLLKSGDPSSAQLRQVGKALARLDHALKDFSHDHEDRLLIWDLKHFPRLRGLLDLLEDPRKLAIAESIFDQFETAVTPLMNSLRWQALHGDFSPFNVVVNASSEDYVVGIIDFGDTVHSPVIFDVSVAMANQLGVDPHEPWRHALDVLAGYRSEYPLEPDEAALLPITAPARLLLRALLAQWRASRSPGSRDYLLSHSDGDWERLYAAMAVPPGVVRSAIHKNTFSPSH